MMNYAVLKYSQKADRKPFYIGGLAVGYGNFNLDII